MSISQLNNVTEALGGLNVKFTLNEPMAAHTGFRAGGCAAVAVFPNTVEQLIHALNVADDYRDSFPTLVLGGGSNTLFCDGVFEGVVIITSGIKRYSFSEPSADGSVLLNAECGVSLTALARYASEYPKGDQFALSGLEFAYGIPGTVGGAVAMNAGAYGGEMKDIVISTVCYDRSKRETVILDYDAHGFSYRKSIFSSSRELVVLNTTVRLNRAARQDVKALMQKNIQARRDKQPLEYPSCGSTFLRPEGRFVGKMTEELGLKGYTVGGAQLSEKHGGFVINQGGATATDILNVINHIKATVLREYGVALECEIKIIYCNSREL
ncbi:MAG: UDP-N-acetylmuramate dehydrogenase [Ruminococcaceae bacterium]|nr:UDP-N-acetylmuramate dehydrogenase [Oscillospiraceae bacterium]